MVHDEVLDTWDTIAMMNFLMIYTRNVWLFPSPMHRCAVESTSYHFALSTHIMNCTLRHLPLILPVDRPIGVHSYRYRACGTCGVISYEDFQ